MSGDLDGGASVEAALRRVEAEEGVRILLAVEAGSRAFGFPSPGSDRDVRFLYAHPAPWYISVAPRRDVIERLGDGLDLVGWDIRKALALILKPNPALLEWLGSPVRYRWSADLAAALDALGSRAAPAAASVHHYRRLAEKIYRGDIGSRGEVAPKLYLHAVRAALAARHARDRDGRPPVRLAALLAAASLDPAPAADLAAVMAAKRAGVEAVPRLPCLDALIEAEIATEPPPVPARDPALEDEADRLLRMILGVERGEDTINGRFGTNLAA